MEVLRYIWDFGIVGVVIIVLPILELLLIIGLLVYIILRNRRYSQAPAAMDFPLLYDEKQQVLYYPIDALQREFGYYRGYDVTAITLGMVIDCEPVRFYWNGRHWLIELWKGQYGLAAGAEIGVYSTSNAETENADVLLYENTQTLLDMDMTLICGDKQVFSRGEYTWWLTGFVPGMFSWPDELSVEAVIGFPVDDMARAFMCQLYEMGYKAGEISRMGNMVRILYTSPKSQQPHSRTRLAEQMNQKTNKSAANVFDKAEKEFASLDDMLNFVRLGSPKLYRRMLRGARPQEGYLTNPDQ